jgi:hypothetical protein
MRFIILIFITILLSFASMVSASEKIDLLPEPSQTASTAQGESVVDASASDYDPWGEMDTSLGAAASLNRALGLVFSGYASTQQLQIEREMADAADAEAVRWALFASDVLARLNRTEGIDFPETLTMKPFDLSPSEKPYIAKDNPHIVVVTYDKEEYLERLLQRLYFKLIQGPVLLTVPYRADAASVPVEYRNWNNFRYGDDADTMTWNETRLVYVDWNLTQTVVLRYEDGKIACYDSGKKYYIDHTAAVVAVAAMQAHPRLNLINKDNSLAYLLVSTKQDSK